MICDACHGSGRFHLHTCRKCKGHGELAPALEVEFMVREIRRKMKRELGWCPVCKGPYPDGCKCYGAYYCESGGEG